MSTEVFYNSGDRKNVSFNKQRRLSQPVSDWKTNADLLGRGSTFLNLLLLLKIWFTITTTLPHKLYKNVYKLTIKANRRAHDGIFQWLGTEVIIPRETEIIIKTLFLF